MIGIRVGIADLRPKIPLESVVLLLVDSVAGTRSVILELIGILVVNNTADRSDQHVIAGFENGFAICLLFKRIFQHRFVRSGKIRKRAIHFPCGGVFRRSAFFVRLGRARPHRAGIMLIDAFGNRTVEIQFHNDRLRCACNRISGKIFVIDVTRVNINLHATLSALLSRGRVVVCNYVEIDAVACERCVHRCAQAALCHVRGAIRECGFFMIELFRQHAVDRFLNLIDFKIFFRHDFIAVFIAVHRMAGITCP